MHKYFTSKSSVKITGCGTASKLVLNEEGLEHFICWRLTLPNHNLMLQLLLVRVRKKMCLNPSVSPHCFGINEAKLMLQIISPIDFNIQYNQEFLGVKNKFNLDNTIRMVTR